MPLLRIERLTHYFGGLRAVHDVNLTLEGGELIGLIGPNGAGKTTVFNLVCGVYRASQGEIRFNNSNLIGMMPHQITTLGIARTFQNIRLWNSMSVLDNIRIAHHARLGYGVGQAVFRTKRYWQQEKEISRLAFDLLEVLGLGHQASTLVRNLPYGQQRRVEIARALAARPRLLLLDEPAAGMNPREIRELQEFISYIRKEFNLTIWLIEHQMQLVMNVCEWIQVLDFGQVIAEGAPEEIQNNRRVIEAYLGEEVA